MISLSLDTEPRPFRNKFQSFSVSGRSASSGVLLSTEHDDVMGH